MMIAVVGGGSWGTAMARLLAMNGHAVTLACRDPEQAEAVNRYHRNPRYLPDVMLPPEIRAAGFDQASLEGVELVAFAVPSAAFAASLRRFADRLPADAALLSLTKGLDPRDRRRMSEVLATVAPAERIAVLSGPNHAEEVARDFPTASVLASLDTDLARRLQEQIGARRLRIYTSTDVIGVELCAAAKNVIGLAAGVSDGLGFGDNAKAAIITRGMAEMARMGEGFGARARTYSGLAGMGDLVATCTSRHSRNRKAGELLAKGVRAEWIERDIGQVVEGLSTSRALRDLAADRGLELPITSAVCDVAWGGVTATDALAALMAREQTEE
jgi:glycerol-3-phosphate dehydrogenase (NAD(P)+)